MKLQRRLRIWLRKTKVYLGGDTQVDDDIEDISACPVVYNLQSTSAFFYVFYMT